jgi:phage terminase large subunit-like protein
MSSSSVALRVGAQRPRLQHLPPGQLSSAGQDAVDFAADCGLILDDWQAWCLDKMLGEDEFGRWVASVVLLILPRQNGKNAVLEALELYAFYVLDEKRILHTAHLAKTAADHMQRMVALVRGNSELDAITHFYWANGKEALQRKDTGARLEFITRGRKTARGGSPNRIVFDEALFLTDEQVQSILPAMSAQSLGADAPQMIYTSSAPLLESSVLHRLRRRGIAGDAGRMFYAEWGCEVGTDLRDRDAWYSANPGMGIRIAEDWVAENELTTMSAEAFAIERLGIVPADDGGSTILPGWEACRVERSEFDARPTHVAVAVGPAGQWAAVVAVGKRVDNTPYVEVIRREAGTAWVAGEALRAHTATGNPVAVDPKSPTAGIIPELAAAGIKLTETSTADYVGACAALQVDVGNGRLAHFGDQALDAAVVGADIRPVGESWAWSQRASTIDITPLVAATLALWASRTAAPAKLTHSASAFVSLDDY